MPEVFPDHPIESGYEEVYGRRELLIWSALARKCEEFNVGLQIFCANQSVAAAFLKGSENMNFRVPDQMAGWDLRSAINEQISIKDWKEGNKIPVGEWFDAPLVIITPLLQTNPIVEGNVERDRNFRGEYSKKSENRYSQMAQISIIMRDVQKVYNADQTTDGAAPHLLEVLSPIGLWMNSATAESILRGMSQINLKFH